MIGRIAGRIDHRGGDHVLIDVRGVGYVVHVSDRTLAALPAVGGQAALYTDLLVREDLLQLFGFTSMVEKEWHRLLMSVQGIGAKASMAILGTLGPDGVSRAIALGDWNAVKAAPGVGPKIAQRVVNELKDKAPSVMAMGVGKTSAEGMAHVGAEADPPEDAAVVEPVRASSSAQSRGAFRASEPRLRAIRCGARGRPGGGHCRRCRNARTDPRSAQASGAEGVTHG